MRTHTLCSAFEVWSRHSDPSDVLVQQNPVIGLGVGPCNGVIGNYLLSESLLAARLVFDEPVLSELGRRREAV